MDQDTTQFDAPWNTDTSQNLKFHTAKGGGMKQGFERPSGKKRKWNVWVNTCEMLLEYVMQKYTEIMCMKTSSSARVEFEMAWFPTMQDKIQQLEVCMVHYSESFIMLNSNVFS